MSNLRKWADEHQYDAEVHSTATEHSGVMPKVYLLHMQDDPLGVLAAQNGIYKGKVYRSLAEVTDDDRRQALDDMMKTTLQSPLESIKMHWLFEGIDRAFTHQHVRQRTANFGQESLRFAVVGDLIDATTLPPELHGTQRSEAFFGTPGNETLGTAKYISFQALLDSGEFAYASQPERNRAVWDWLIMNIDAAYHYEVEHGLAAEEARGLLPHCTATRIHYQTDLRGLMKVMGERLCTQAQFHWRTVAALVRGAVRNYTPDFSWVVTGADVEFGDAEEITRSAQERWEHNHRWQFELLADSGIFQPVCYQTGKCMFQASADRGCTIRERVENLGSKGIPSDRWDQFIGPQEWLLDPGAARKVSE